MYVNDDNNKEKKTDQRILKRVFKSLTSSWKDSVLIDVQDIMDLQNGVSVIRNSGNKSYIYTVISYRFITMIINNWNCKNNNTVSYNVVCISVIQIKRIKADSK